MPSEVSTAGADQNLDRVVDELKRELEHKSRELAEAREQQATTAGILAAISSSPADLRRVCVEIAANAARLCDAYDAVIGQVDGDSIRLVAHHGPIPIAPVGQATMPLTRGVTSGRAILDRQTIHVADLQAEMDEYPQSLDTARQLGIRTVLAHPLMREDVAIGVIGMRRTEVRPFTEKQIELLKLFADQAVIAIEKTRLFEAEQVSKRELQESLEYQTAISDVLNVISRSKFELQPVLDTLAQSATQLCEAEQSAIFLREGNVYCIAARHGYPPELEEYARQHPISPGRNTVTGRVALECRVVHIPDVLADPEYSYGAQPLGGYRALIGVPLLREGSCIGAIAVTRTTLNRSRSSSSRLPIRQ